MKITYLGTCSGTEPKPGMHHTSLVIEVEGVLYWFDAGECCAFSAHNSGMDVTRTRALFVSHPHYDHTGGLANLLACMGKLGKMFEKPMINNNTLEVFFPDSAVFGAILTVANSSATKRNLPFEIIEHGINDGVIFDDGRVKVTALHNRHLREDGSQGWHSFSFLIEAEGKRVVFSGDVLSSTELDPFTEVGCDLLIHETGHHAPRDVCDYAASRKVGALRFTHHGRAIINDRAGAEALVGEASAASGISMIICHDGMSEEL